MKISQVVCDDCKAELPAGAPPLADTTHEGTLMHGTLTVKPEADLCPDCKKRHATEAVMALAKTMGVRLIKPNASPAPWYRRVLGMSAPLVLAVVCFYCF